MLLWGNDVLGPGFWQAACGLERWNTEEKRLSLCFQMCASTITQDINACMQMVLSVQNGDSQDLTTCPQCGGKWTHVIAMKQDQNTVKIQ